MRRNLAKKMTSNCIHLFYTPFICHKNNCFRLNTNTVLEKSYMGYSMNLVGIVMGYYSILKPIIFRVLYKSVAQGICVVT